jgi:hypothetical protein
MIEQLIDVTMGERILHTFPITIRNPLSETRDEAFKEKALEAAANAHLVADEELGRLRANVHVSRSGPLESWGDSLGVLAETKTGLDQIVRDRAYSLWERAGRPNGVAEECWIQAQHQRWCERAYALWEREGCPTGKADDHWARIRDFENN